ncbi:MAG: tripartite tricarboxylate transporter TctB family protein [Deltaproteobacteria bacterium]|nr:tripartite tricarboxylate transporter TctB family protein [Deltaproteobacteria bacterium]
MKKADRIFALICLGLSGWLIQESFKYDYMTKYTPGPGFHPFWLGICLGLLSLFLIFDTFRRKGVKEDQESQLPGKKALIRVGLILLVTAVLALLMTRLGFVLSSFVFIALTLGILEKFKIVKSVLYSAAFSAGIFLIFRYWLEVDLPRGWFGF